MSNQLIRRLAIEYGGSYKHLPPWNATCKRTPILNRVQHERRWAGAGAAYVLATRRLGTRLEIAGNLGEDNPAAGLTEQAEITDALFDETGRARVVGLCDWLDESDTIPGIWRGCKCVDLQFNVERFEGFAAFAITLETAAIVPELTAADGSKPDAGPYEAYIYNGALAINPETGEPDAGEGATPPEAGPMPITQHFTMTFHFAGLAEVTDADNAARMQQALVLGSGYKITAIQITGSGSIGDATTRACVSAVGYDTATTIYRATVDSGNGSGGRTTIAPGLSATTVYVWLDQAGGHGDVTVALTVESA